MAYATAQLHSPCAYLQATVVLWDFVIQRLGPVTPDLCAAAKIPYFVRHNDIMHIK